MFIFIVAESLFNFCVATTCVIQRQTHAYNILTDTKRRSDRFFSARLSLSPVRGNPEIPFTHIYQSWLCSPKPLVIAF